MSNLEDKEAANLPFVSSFESSKMQLEAPQSKLISLVELSMKRRIRGGILSCANTKVFANCLPETEQIKDV